jgi:histidine ammonia-lyase
MGTTAGRKLGTVIENSTHVLAIELMCAAQGLDLRQKLAAGKGVAAAHKFVRTVVPHLDEDRVLADDIRRLRDKIEDGSLVAAVEEAVGPLE